MNDSDQAIFKVNLLKFSFEPSAIQLPPQVLIDLLGTGTRLKIIGTTYEAGNDLN